MRLFSFFKRLPCVGLPAETAGNGLSSLGVGTEQASTPVRQWSHGSKKKTAEENFRLRTKERILLGSGSLNAECIPTSNRWPLKRTFVYCIEMMTIWCKHPEIVSRSIAYLLRDNNNMQIGMGHMAFQIKICYAQTKVTSTIIVLSNDSGGFFLENLYYYNYFPRTIRRNC